MDDAERCWREDARGYRIVRCRVGERLRYCAFAPEMDGERYAEQLRVRYRRGETVPQRREHLGCFDDFDGARQACINHREKIEVTS
jgi:hypothetical protein